MKSVQRETSGSVAMHYRRASRLGMRAMLTVAVMLGFIVYTPLPAQQQQPTTMSGGGQLAMPAPYSPTTPTQGSQPAMNSLNPNLPASISSQLPISGVGGLGTETVYPDPQRYTLHGGDLISVRLYGMADYEPIVRLSDDGSATLPLIGSMKLGDLTVQQAQSLIADKLKTESFYRNPEITITVAESRTRTLTLSGEMHGVFFLPASGQRSLIDVLAAAGGLPTTASHVISIIRPGVPEPILVDIGNTPLQMAKANVPVQANDMIFVEKTGVVYALGAFRYSGVFPMQSGVTTLLQVAALTGGPLYQAKYEDMRIIRTVGTQRTEVKLDVKKVMDGRAPDPILQSGDILYLPNSAVKTAIASNGVQVLLSIVSLLIVAFRN